MKATHLIQVLVILVLSVGFTLARTAPSAQPSAPLAETVVVATATTGSAAAVAETDEIAYWLITDEESRWTAEEIEILQRVLQNTFAALAANGIDGMALLDGYRFRRDASLFIDDVEGRMGIIDHNVGEITLSDKAFTVLHGFAIYHELGHAVDYRMDRQLSEAFHRHTGGPEISEDGGQWQTADDYWLRLQGRDDREEATADAFAVLVMVSHAGLKQPVFAHQPVTTDYAGISTALALALQDWIIYPPDIGGKKHNRQFNGTVSCIELWTPSMVTNPTSSGTTPRRVATSKTDSGDSRFKVWRRCAPGASCPKSSISTAIIAYSASNTASNSVSGTSKVAL